MHEVGGLHNFPVTVFRQVLVAGAGYLQQGIQSDDIAQPQGRAGRPSQQGSGGRINLLDPKSLAPHPLQRLHEGEYSQAMAMKLGLSSASTTLLPNSSRRNRFIPSRIPGSVSVPGTTLDQFM